MLLRKLCGRVLYGLFLASGLLFSRSVMSNSLQPHGRQHARLPCPSLSPGFCSNSCALSQRCHPTISSSVTHFSSCPQSFSASGSFPMSQLFALGSQNIGASALASVFPMNSQGRFLLGLTGLISLLSKGLSRDFSSTTVWKHQFFSTQPSSLAILSSPSVVAASITPVSACHHMIFFPVNMAVSLQISLFVWGHPSLDLGAHPNPVWLHLNIPIYLSFLFFFFGCTPQHVGY